MNILFVYTSQIIPKKGGVQRVTKVLGDYFETFGIKVKYLSMLKSKSFEKNHFFLPNSKVINADENLQFISSFVLKHKIDIIINQAALGGVMSRLCFEAKKNSSVKILSVIHNSLLGNVDAFAYTNKKIFKIIPLSFFSFIKSKFFKKFLIRLYVFKYRKSYKKLYDYSDKIIVLSKSYISQYKLFVKNTSSDKILSIYNPCSFEKELYNCEKKNELLFVGRLNTTQKRVDLLLKIWKKIYLKFPNWKLNILGDGPDLKKLKNISKKMNLERIFFVGYHDPIPYYKKAKFLCMTSSYEGLPLVLSEAQNYGVYPILFNSFASAGDVINNKVNGSLINPFDIKSYVNELSNLLINYNSNSKILKSELKKNADRFSINIIGSQWIDLFNKTLNE